MKKTSLLIILTFIISLYSSVCVHAENADNNIDFDNDFKWEAYKYGDNITLPYFMYLPKDYNENTEYPVVILLQRAGKDEKTSRNNMQEMAQYLFENSNTEAYRSIVIAAQSTSDNGWGYGYGDVYETDSSKALVELIGALKQNYSIDIDRIYLIGASMGGYGVYDLLIRHNNIFTAGIIISSGGDYSKAEILKDTPIYVFHGEEDKVVLVREARNMVEAIKAAGGTKIQYVEYKKMGHDIVDSAMAKSGLLDWLFSQKLSDRYTDTAQYGISAYMRGESLNNIQNSSQTKASGNPYTAIIIASSVALGIIISVVISCISVRSRKIKFINKR